MGFHHIWPIFILGMAVSIDGFAVGITYGIRKIKIRILYLLLVGSISAISIYLTLTIGSLFSSIMNPGIAKKIGGVILISMGCWVLYNAYINWRNKGLKDKKSIEDDNCVEYNNESRDKRTLYTLRIKSLGIIIKILREPVSADFDKSGTINFMEAAFLGFALALDAMGAGLGAGLVGFTGVWIPIMIGSINVFFVGTGFMLGRKIGEFLPDYFELIPGLVIISLGIFNIFK
ncbi:MAG: sporulation membrane protein YtaF [Halanaerobiales bacterium]